MWEGQAHCGLLKHPSWAARGERISKPASSLLHGFCSPLELVTWKCRPHKPSFLVCFWPECLSLQQRENQSRVLCEETLCVINFPFGYWDRDHPGTPGWPLSWESSFLSLQCGGRRGQAAFSFRKCLRFPALEPMYLTYYYVCVWVLACSGHSMYGSQEAKGLLYRIIFFSENFGYLGCLHLWHLNYVHKLRMCLMER